VTLRIIIVTQQHELIMMGITAAVFAAIGWVAGRIFQRWRDINKKDDPIEDRWELSRRMFNHPKQTNKQKNNTGT